MSPATRTLEAPSIWTDWTHIPVALKVLTVVSVLGALGLPTLYFVSFPFGLSDKQEVWGQFGDFIGGSLNPIFSFSALFALLYTVVLQSRELRHSTEQLERSAEALDKQNAVLVRQSFESTFFQLLTLYREVVQHLSVDLDRIVDVRLKKVRFDDRACFAELHAELMKHFQPVQRGDVLGGRREALNEGYKAFYASFGDLVGHYFRTIYNIIKFVEQIEMPEETKKTYVNLLRAQLSRYELGLLLYNCVSDFGWEKMRPLVLKYRVLKHVEDSVLASPADRDLME